MFCRYINYNVNEVYIMNYDDLFAKALANFLHREIIEDAHAKYNISQEEMEQMNRKAVNRAKLLAEIMLDTKKLDAFTILYSLAVINEWDDPIETEDINDIRKVIEYTAETGKLF